MSRGQSAPPSVSDTPLRMSWWKYGLVGGLGLNLVTLISAPLKLIAHLNEHRGEPIPWRELSALPVFLFGAGFACGTMVWALSALSRQFGLLGDSLTGMIAMVVFLLCCMLVFDPALLQGETPGRGLMLVLGVVIGMVLGAWIGRDLRNFSIAQHPQPAGDDQKLADLVADDARGE